MTAERRVFPRPSVANGFWQHHKTGGIYDVYGMSQDEATGAWYVLYRNPHSGAPWHRPVEEFVEKFVYLGSDHRLT